jgi:branched-chain amino acid transport system substrate-binding protein
VLLPTSDTVIGPGMLDAIDVAIDQINRIGVLGQPVGVVIADEGTTTASASNSLQTLLRRDVDAIVGPGSSLLTLGVLDQIVAAGVLACSPTASAAALDGFPDDGLFFRTIPSDTLQAQAIAEAADQTGAASAVIAHVDDAYGRALADAVGASIQSEVVEVTQVVAFDGLDDDLSAEARQVLDSGAPVVIILADADDTTRLLQRLDEFDVSGLTTIIVNDAIRNPANPQLIAALGAGLREKIVGLAPQVESPDAADPFDPPGPFAANAYDCVNLIALAAMRAGSDRPRDIADQMAAVSSAGSVCRNFPDCVAGLEGGLQIDYNGPSGVTDLDARLGDPARALFDRFVFGADGTDEFQRAVIAGR